MVLCRDDLLHGLLQGEWVLGRVTEEEGPELLGEARLVLACEVIYGCTELQHHARKTHAKTRAYRKVRKRGE